MTTPDQPSIAESRNIAGKPPLIEIEFFFDFVCPWCLIGERHLRTALRLLAEVRPDVQVRMLWRSHQLLPDIPPAGLPYQSFYIARLGSAEAVAWRRAQVQQAGDLAGIEFAFERIEMMPNTLAAHKLVAVPAASGRQLQQSALIDRLFSAYFMNGEDIGDPTVLQRHALEHGIEREGLQQYLADPSSGRDVLAASLYAEYVSGVPFFVFNGVQVISGAQPPSALLQLMLELLRD